jgi:hypothetical protein
MNFLLIVNILVGWVVVVHATCSINAMTRQTDHVYRLGYILLAVSALAVVVGPFYGYTKPQWSEVLFNAGAGLVLIRGWWLREVRTPAGGASR